MSDTNTDLARVSIKAVPARTKEAIARLAQRRGQTQGEWLAELVDKGERVQAGDLVDRTLFDQPRPAEEPPAAAASPGVQLLLDPAHLALLTALAERSSSKQAQRLAAGLLVDYLKHLRAGFRSEPAVLKRLALGRS